MASSSREVQVISDQIFDYSSLVKNSNETKCFKSDLLQELNNEFNTKEQSIFVTPKPIYFGTP
jgi:hypothetical protein